IQTLGAAALAVIPLLDHKGFVGFISITWVNPRKISSEILDMLRLVGEIFLNALERKHNEGQIQRQNDFQQILIDLATNFINLPVDEIDLGITQALKRIVEFIGAMRCAILGNTEDSSHFYVLYDWTSPQHKVFFPPSNTIRPHSPAMIKRLQ